MSERRSDRSRKQIDYSKFGDGQDDDDFEDAFAASKKKKTTNKENSKVKKIEKKPTADRNTKIDKKRERPNPKEKVFDNELQIALEVSLAETQICSQPNDVSKEESVELKINDHPVSPKKSLEDEIVVIEENVLDDPPSKRRRTTSGNNKDDQEYTAEDVSDVDDDDDFDVSNDENDSDFDCEAKKTTKKKTKVSKKAQPESNKSKSKPVSTPKVRTVAPKTTPMRAAAPVHKPTTPSPAVGSAARKHVWNPPNKSDSCKSPLGLSVKSPTSGIRIGLSRNQRVKPLHPSLKLQP